MQVPNKAPRWIIRFCDTVGRWRLVDTAQTGVPTTPVYYKYQSSAQGTADWLNELADRES